MTHRASRARAAEAYTRHLDGDTWQEIADALGFRSRQGAQDAVNRHLAETTPDPSNIARRKWTDRKHRQRRRLCRQLSVAETLNDSQAVAQLSAAIDRVDDQLAKAENYYAPQKLDVTVGRSPAELLAESKAQTLAALAERRGNVGALPVATNVIDAEVIEA